MLDRKVYTLFNHPGSHGFKNDLPTVTEKSHAESCDINVIVRRATAQGVIEPLLPTHSLKYGDVSDFGSYHESLTIITRNQQAFEQLPSELRAKFGNSIGEFLEWMDNPANTEEAIKLGLKVRVKNEPDPVRVQVVPAADLVLKGTTDTSLGGSSNNGDNSNV